MESLRRDALEDQRETDDEEYGPPLVPDFGFHYPLEFVETTVAILEASSWVCWPDGFGGWADQDAFLIDDVMLYLKLRRRAKWETEHGITDMTEEQHADLPTMRLDDL